MSNRRRRRSEPVVATCLTCGWSATGNTWRPVKRRLAEHTAKKHRSLAGARIPRGTPA